MDLTKIQMKQNIKIQTKQTDQAQSPKDQNQQTLKTKPKHKEQMNSKKVKQIWILAEERRYLKFLIAKQDLFGLSVSERKKAKVNVMMSKAVRSKTSNQCHSHHQKMAIKYGSISGIIKQIQQRLKRAAPKQFYSFDRQQIKCEQEQQMYEMVKREKQQNDSEGVLKQQSESAQFYIRYYPDKHQALIKQQEV